MAKSGTELGNEAKSSSSPKGSNRGFAIMDFVLRLVAIVGTIASAVVMGTASEKLPFFTQFLQFRAEYNDLPTFTFFVIANAVACGYLAISLSFSISHIVRSNAQRSRIILIVFDAAILILITAGASASAAIVYLAHQGNTNTNWFAICQQFNSFCELVSGALVGSYVAVAMLFIIIFLLAVAISRA